MTTMANAPVATKVEDRLYYNRYVVDSGRPHIRVKPHTKPSKALTALLRVCPAHCYDLNDRGQVEITPDGCLECGTCRVVCAETGEIEWTYPRGGFGVLFKFG
jgi:ferredoxin like protein